MTDEKRRFPRVFFGAHAVLEVEGESYEVEEITSISIGGCLLPIESSLREGSECRTCIYLTGSSSERVVRAEGKIVRTEPGRVAIQFTGMDPDSLYHLHNVVRYNVRDADKVEREISRHPGLL